MGTIYQSNCGCLSSRPEPDWSDPYYGQWPEPEARAMFDADMVEWQTDWSRQCDQHEVETGHRA